jgi:hypothetical protein
MEYAMPRSGQGVQVAAAQIAAVIQALAFARRRHLVGPVLAKIKEDPLPSTPAGPLRIKMDDNAFVFGFASRLVSVRNA